MDFNGIDSESEVHRLANRVDLAGIIGSYRTPLQARTLGRDIFLKPIYLLNLSVHLLSINDFSLETSLFINLVQQGQSIDKSSHILGKYFLDTAPGVLTSSGYVGGDDYIAQPPHGMAGGKRLRIRNIQPGTREFPGFDCSQKRGRFYKFAS